MIDDNILTRSLRALPAALRLIARCLRCYIQLRNEQRELSGLSQRSLRDIGLTEYDVAMDVQRPAWRRCWRQVRSRWLHYVASGSILGEFDHVGVNDRQIERGAGPSCRAIRSR